MVKKGMLALLGLTALAAAGLYVSATTKAYDYPEEYPASYPGTSEYNRRGPTAPVPGKPRSIGGRFTVPHPGEGYYENPTQ